MASRTASARRAPSCVALSRRLQAQGLMGPAAPAPGEDSAQKALEAAEAAEWAAEKAAAAANRAAMTPATPPAPSNPISGGGKIIIEEVQKVAPKPGSVTLSLQALVSFAVVAILLALLIANIVELSRTRSALSRLALSLRVREARVAPRRPDDLFA